MCLHPTGLHGQAPLLEAASPLVQELRLIKLPHLLVGQNLLLMTTKRFVSLLVRWGQVAHHQAPTLGQDSDAVLREIGLTEAQIQALKDQGIVG